MNCLAPSVTSVRDFVPQLDASWLHGLWHRAMHERWTISPRAMLSTLTDAALLLVAECEGLRSGFCAVQRNGGSAGLTLLLVEPTMQRQGIGTELLSRAEKKLKNWGVNRLALGAGNGSYFWPGLPNEQRTSCSFFRKRGFVEEEFSEDLIQDLQDFEIPEWVEARLAASCAELRLAEPADESRIAVFEQLQFPAWAAYFANEMGRGGYGNILFAQDPEGDILGTLLMRHDTCIPWTTMDANRMGTLNTLGVVPERQGQGIGLALTSKAMEVLRKRGSSHCFIQWTGLAEWYGKLGARTWAHYHMASKILVSGSLTTS